jgi:threonine/homoserine/homoserine lactone efflux protein
MMLFAVSIYFIATTIVGLNIIPGPTIFYITHQTMRAGLRSGLWSIAGAQAGTLLHIAASVFGLSLYILHSHIAFMAIRYCGAIFLIYLGLSTFKKNKPKKIVAKPYIETGNWAAFYQGTLISLLNPKVILYFILLLPQFVNENSVYVNSQLLILGIGFLVVGSCIQVAISLCVSSKLNSVLAAHSTLSHLLTYLTSFIFMGFGIFMFSL